VQYKSILAMILNEIKCHVNTSLGLVGGMHPLHPPCVRAWVWHLLFDFNLYTNVTGPKIFLWTTGCEPLVKKEARPI